MSTHTRSASIEFKINRQNLWNRQNKLQLYAGCHSDTGKYFESVVTHTPVSPTHREQIYRHLRNRNEAVVEFVYDKATSSWIPVAVKSTNKPCSIEQAVYTLQQRITPSNGRA
jgi:hypothetical protein